MNHGKNTGRRNNEVGVDIFFLWFSCEIKNEGKFPMFFHMSNSCEPGDAIVTPSIGMEILHFFSDFPTIQQRGSYRNL